MGGFAWVTLATNDSYSLGALVLAHSLKQAGTTQQLAVLVTPGVTNAMREKLAQVFNLVQEVNILDSKDEANLRLLKRPELGITFTKLHCWRLTQYDKCVFLDADTLVLQNCDELFEREELSAAPDVGWPDCFNSGVFVYRPSNETYQKLIQFALEKGSFDGGDQGLLNLYFSDWAYKDISKHLPFIYNLCSTACYSYLPAFKQFGGNAKIIHFIGATKPWLQYFNSETRQVQPSSDAGHLRDVLQRWWEIFCSLIHPNLSPEMAGLAGAFAQLILGVPRTAEQEALESHLRRQAWEVGNIDYLGRDSFENIWSKILDTLSKSPEKESEAAPTPVTVPDPVTPIEQPKAPTETPATEDKTPESQLQAPQSPKQEEIKVPATPTPAPVPTPDEASKPEAALEQPADPALTPTATPEESKLLQEQEPPAQVIPPAEVAPVPSPTIETIPEPKSSQELPAPLPESHAPPESPAPLPESPASLPDPVPAPAVAGEQPSELKPADLTQIPAVIEKPVETDKPIVEVKSEAVVEILKPESVVLPATELEKTPEIPPPEVERSKKTVVEPTTVPQSEAPKPEPPTPVSEVHDQTPDSVPVKEIESPKVSDTSSTTITSPQTPNVPELPSAQPVQSAKVLPEVPPTSVPVSEPIAKVPKTIEPTASVPSNAPESLTCPLKAELPKPTDKPSQTTPATEPPKATEESAQTPEAPKKPDTSSRSIKKLEPAVSKAETKVTEASPPATPATPPIEQAKEALAVESAVPETPPPAEAGAAGQPQAPPRKVVKKSGTKKAK